MGPAPDHGHRLLYRPARSGWSTTPTTTLRWCSKPQSRLLCPHHTAACRQAPTRMLALAGMGVALALAMVAVAVGPTVAMVVVVMVMVVVGEMVGKGAMAAHIATAKVETVEDTAAAGLLAAAPRPLALASSG